MGKEKKNGSFLFNFYQKYLKTIQNKQKKNIVTENSSISEEIKATVPDSEVALEIPSDKEYLIPLFELYNALGQPEHGEKQIVDLLSFESWVLSPVSKQPFYDEYRDEIQDFLKRMCKEASDYLMILSAAEDPAEPDEEVLKTEIKVPNDASVQIMMTNDKMFSFLLVLPPYFEGNELSNEAVSEALKSLNIAYGTDDPLLKSIVDSQLYMQIYMIAQGKEPIRGKDGEIIDHINYSSEIAIQQDNRGNADFKNLNLIHNVTKDQIICEIIPAEDGIPGMDITGRVINAVNGKPAIVPMGKNTVLSEDGTKLQSAIDGQITLKNNHYSVEPVLIIKENVDYGVGNIDFLGSVIIYGDLCNGFTVKAGGDVTVRGMVESAVIIAEGNVTISKGMNGNYTGKIEAKGDVKSGFFENSTIYAGGNLYSNSFVSCNLFCGDTVYVQGNPGVIIGGTITAYRCVEAKVIGSKSRRETTIVLGEIPRLFEMKNELQKKIDDNNDTLSKLEKNIAYLNRMKASLPEEKLKVLNELKQQRILYLEQKTELKKSLKELNNNSINFNECRVKSNMIYPPTKITIGSQNYTIETLSSNCNVFLTDDGIQVGML